MDESIHLKLMFTAKIIVELSMKWFSSFEKLNLYRKKRTVRHILMQWQRRMEEMETANILCMENERDLSILPCRLTDVSKKPAEHWEYRKFWRPLSSKTETTFRFRDFVSDSDPTTRDSALYPPGGRCPRRPLYRLTHRVFTNDPMLPVQ